MLGDGTARCWGDNTWGQQGFGSTSGLPEGSPVQVMRRAGVVANGMTGVQGSALTTCTQGPAFAGIECWGTDASGEFGNGSLPTANPWAATANVRDRHNPFRLASGGANHGTSCVIESNGNYVFCWGAGGFGQIGDNTILDASTPQRVALAFQQSVVALGSGPAADHTCFLAADESAWCWGRASQGQLGDGVGYASYLQPVPVQVIGF